MKYSENKKFDCSEFIIVFLFFVNLKLKVLFINVVKFKP